jgi:ubiquinone/menaquinone biosynthesis C-methylase UbiE
MRDTLKLESEKLARSWMQHESAKLREYLVAGVEDPRINLQSILSRHFLVRSLFGEKYRELMNHECRFAAVMNWFTAFAANSDPEELNVVFHALQLGADNAEGIQIPRFILKTFGSLPELPGNLEIPNYIEAILTEATRSTVAAPTHEEKGRVGGTDRPVALNAFQNLWHQTLAAEAAPGPALTVFEPACGSANDYRFLHSYGLFRFLDYTGLDLCSKNVENARALFPVTPTFLSASGARFEQGNVFEINAQDNAFEFSFVHDLFEHLSIEGLHAAVNELCRVTRRAICANFFQMDEIPEHVVRPTDEYHWNLLSMNQIKKLFATHAFVGQIIHIKSFLRQQFGCDYTHNPNAYTFVLHRA